MTKFFFFIMCLQTIAASLLIAAESNAQSKSIYEIGVKVNLNEALIIESFDKIEALTGFKFSYNSEVVNVNQKISASGKTTFGKLLEEISGQTDLKFRRIDKNIHVYKKDKSETIVEETVLEFAVTISGKITDENGESLPGATVMEKGTSNGAITDLDGNYKLSVQEGATLVISFIGYATSEIAVNGRSTVDVQMRVDVTSLSEVLVVGYGEVKRENLTGSVGSVSQQELKAIAISSLDQGMQGRVAGVQVNQASAEPGGGVAVRIRGVNSINGSNEPLYVIDGIPIINNDGAVSASGGGRQNVASNALASLNPGDIASMEILKDASATAIYGARGANGVVIITTNKGKAGKTKVSFENYYGVQVVANQYDLANARMYGEWANAFAENEGIDPFFSNNQLDSLSSAGTDWQKEAYRQAAIQNHQISISGGNDKTTFFVSANYFKQDGVIKQSSFDRTTFRINFDHYISDKFKIGTTTTFSSLSNNRVPTSGNNDGVTSAAQSALPIMPIFQEDGSYMNVDVFQNQLPSGLDIADTQPNAVSKINETTDIESTNMLLSNVYANYEIVEGLNFKVSVGANVTERNRDTYFSQQSDEARLQGGRAIVGVAERQILLNENTLSFNRLFGKHDFKAVTGFTAQYEEFQNRVIANSGFGIDDPDFNINNISAGTQVGGASVSSFKRDESLASFLFRVAYAFDDRYLLTFTSRADGSSKFSESNKWGFFPSAAVAWKINNESFFEGVTTVSNLKLRASYGQTGFQEIQPYQSLAQYGPQNYSFNNVQVVGYEPIIPASADLTWQTTTQFDIGLDVGFFQEKLYVTADYYVKNTNDLLLFVRPAANTGYSNALATNIGEVRNTGWEFTVGSNLSNGNLAWNSNLNISGNQNEVLDLGNQKQIFGGRISSDRRDDGNLTQVGEPIGVFFGYKTDGIFSSEEEVQQHTTLVDGVEVLIQPDAAPGERRFVDTNEDGKFDGDDRTKIGDPYPDFIYGWSNSFSYKSFDLSIFLQGSYGNEILNIAKEVLVENDPETNILVERFEQRWTPDNLNAKYPKAGAQNPIRGGSGGFGDYTVEDGSYLRIRDVTLGFRPDVSNVNWLSALRVYASVQNALTFTKYSGVNPEGSAFGQNAANYGVDSGGYPIARTFRLGLDFTL